MNDHNNNDNDNDPAAAVVVVTLRSLTDLTLSLSRFTVYIIIDVGVVLLKACILFLAVHVVELDSVSHSSMLVP